MKTIKLLLVLVFCLAVMPATAQKVREVLPENAKKLDNAELAILPQLKGGSAVRNSGALSNFVYSVEAGAGNLMAQVVNEEKGYGMFLEKFVNDGQVLTAKYCAGNEKFCKSITNGRVCDTSAAPPTDWCFLEGMNIAAPGEAPMIPEEAVLEDQLIEDLFVEYCR